MVRNEYLDQYYPYYADALKAFLSILATIFNYNLKQPNLPPERLKLYEKRGYICIVQKLANHKNISTTQHYFNYNDQMLANAVENVRI